MFHDSCVSWYIHPHSCHILDQQQTTQDNSGIQRQQRTNPITFWVCCMFRLACSITFVCRDIFIRTHAISLISSKRRHRTTRVSSASKEQTPLPSGYVSSCMFYHSCVSWYTHPHSWHIRSAANDTEQLGHPAPANNKLHYLLDGQNVTATRKNGIFTITRRPNNRFGNDQQIKFFISDICESVTVLSDVLSVKSFKIFKDVILFESNYLFRKIRSNKIQ